MAVVDPKRLSDGFLSLEGGIDSGVAPNLIQKNQSAWMVNAQTRDGWITCRPGWTLCDLNWQGEDESQSAFEGGRFQVGGTYVSDQGIGYLMASIGGRQFSLMLEDGSDMTAKEITIASDLNSSLLEQAWCCQAENYWLLQNGQEKCFIWNGGTARRAGKYEIPVGRQITYYMGRIWVAKGRRYAAGNIVFGQDGRAEILNFTENTYLREGGDFAVPAQFGDITAFKPIASINTALGQGELLTYTQQGVFATLVPQDRATWATTSNPIQRVIQLRYGAYSQNAVVDVNEDHWYRAQDGIRSIAYSVRNSGQPGNVGMSHEEERALQEDTEALLRFGSGVLFDNRLLMTCSPHFEREHGIYHTALAVMDMHPTTPLRDKQPPVWQGIWTGIRILQIVTLFHRGAERCFVFALNSSNKIEIWEITKTEPFDNGETRIEWMFETRSMDFGQKFDRHDLFAADCFYDNIVGTVDFEVEFRPDSYPCWVPWDTWQECSKYRTCATGLPFAGCPTLAQYKETYRVNRQLKQPPDTMDTIMHQMFRRGFEHQFRISITGHCRVKQMRVNSYQVQQPPYGEQL